MKIALATPRVASSVNEALVKMERLVSSAAAQGAEIVCFPEAWLPGLRGLDFQVPPFELADQERALRAAAICARANRIAVVLGMEWIADGGRQIAAVVFGAGGEIQGMQTKNQLDPTEEPRYVPGDTRRLFEVNGVRFGIAICHEAFRYPETVRWAAVRGAKLVFHPHCTGNDRAGPTLTHWASPEAPYYEKAITCRALENGIYVAAVNYAFRHQESATAVVGPGGELVAHHPYGQEGLLVADIDPAAATGLLASRYAPERYREETPAMAAGSA